MQTEARIGLVAATVLYVVTFVAGFVLVPENPEQFVSGDPYTKAAFLPILKRNLLVVALMLGGVLTFGLMTLIQLTLNAAILGATVSLILSDGNPEFVLAGIAPHLPFELAGLLLASGVGLTAPIRFLYFLSGKHDSMVDRAYLRRIGRLTALTLGCIFVGAVVEAFVTPVFISTFT